MAFLNENDKHKLICSTFLKYEQLLAYMSSTDYKVIQLETVTEKIRGSLT
jgi:hypothetical protein